ncbi:MAG: MnmC family methyltransferase [Candidatus Micrarchaeia archaeon]
MYQNQNFVLSGYHINTLLKSTLGNIKISLNLGLSHEVVNKTENFIYLPNGESLDLSILKKISKRRSEHDCFIVEDNDLSFIYSFENSSVYKLYEPHMDWPPTLFINGSVMHAVSVSKPTEEGEIKANMLGEVKNNIILDTCFGLGYSSIRLLDRGAKYIYSYEISESVIKIAKINPWSRKAFEDNRLSLKNKDIKKDISELKNEYFDKILHDPPNVKIDGDLYSLNFYKELYRILKPKGILYHFVGGGRIPREYKVDYLKGVVNRLAYAGFKNIKKSYRGVIAEKA